MNGKKKSMSKQMTHPLFGSSLSNLLGLFSRYGFPAKGHKTQTVLMLLAIMGRLPFTAAEKAFVALRRKQVEPIPPPVFILGHWRSGTTHLYNIMSKGRAFSFVSPFATALPHDFLILTKLFRPLLAKSLPKGRFIDQVAVTPESPQEDEFALANMMPFSFCQGLYFPKDFENTFNRGLFFEGVGKDDVENWKEKLKTFYLKLQMENPGKTILIKNPTYTARVKLLQEIWPDAKFIHIHRNPYKIFFSMRNFYQQLFSALALQEYSMKGIDDHIFKTYSRMMDVLEKETKDLPKKNFIELEFSELQDKPLTALGKIYTRLGLEGFENDKKPYQAYLDSVKGYRKNIYRFPENDLKRIEKHWGRYIRKWRYKRP